MEYWWLFMSLVGIKRAWRRASGYAEAQLDFTRTCMIFITDCSVDYKYYPKSAYVSVVLANSEPKDTVLVRSYATRCSGSTMESCTRRLPPYIPTLPHQCFFTALRLHLCVSWLVQAA